MLSCSVIAGTVCFDCRHSHDISDKSLVLSETDRVQGLVLAPLSCLWPELTSSLIVLIRNFASLKFFNGDFFDGEMKSLQTMYGRQVALESVRSGSRASLSRATISFFPISAVVDLISKFLKEVGFGAPKHKAESIDQSQTSSAQIRLSFVLDGATVAPDSRDRFRPRGLQYLQLSERA